MWNYTEMYSASSWPAGATVASVSQALADIHLSMINHWGEMQRDIIRRYTTSIEQQGFIAASDEQTPHVEDTAAEPDEGDVEDFAVDEPVTHNAALAILNNPALAAEVATRGANDAVDYEVHDDVADDIAAEIQREARPEFDPPNT